MDRWMALGIFLFGAGGGSLASALLHAAQIRKLKRLLNAATYNNSQTAEQDEQSGERKSA